MVGSVAKCMEALIKFYNNKIPSNENFTRVVLIGSSYASKVGYDQSWSYHVCKAAQLSLVRFFSIRSNGFYSINLLSPATYMKQGSEDYWTTSGIQLHNQIQLVPGFAKMKDAHSQPIRSGKGQSAERSCADLIHRRRLYTHPWLTSLSYPQLRAGTYLHHPRHAPRCAVPQKNPTC